MLEVVAGELKLSGPYAMIEDWAAYTPEQHGLCREHVGRRMPQLGEHACAKYLDGFAQTGLHADRIPNLGEVSRPGAADRLGIDAGDRVPTGRRIFQDACGAPLPDDHLTAGREAMDYTPEPDIFHDVFAHVPLHAHSVFAIFLERYGRISAGTVDRPEALERLGRLFWFMVEFGVIRQRGGVEVYESGLISSHAECTRVPGAGARCVSSSRGRC